MAHHLLNPARFASLVDGFAALDVPEDVVNLVPNAQAFDWMKVNVPFFECSDAEIERVYLYRWWTYRKHLKQTPAGIIVTEFITPVRHAASHNAISCALGFHLAEGRWIREPRYLDEYVTFWFRAGENNTPEPKFHQYSSWLASALLDRALVLGDFALMEALFDELVADYRRWEAEKALPDGLFWQFDVRDGMEESITGSRTHRNARPTISSYMYGNALALADMAARLNRTALVAEFAAKAAHIKSMVESSLWDDRAEFFKVRLEDGTLSDAREAIGFIPWQFNLPSPGKESAWKQLTDPDGFWAPMGLTTAERRHLKFRTHGVGKCEWDGACWPFATSQTLYALANLLRHYEQPHVTRADYLKCLEIYAHSHRWPATGAPYIGEYHDEITGEWLKGNNPRSRFYNHSTFCDLIITGLVGLMPRGDDTIELDPLLPGEAWSYFCLDNVPYHGKSLTIVWDRDGSRYGKEAGLSLFVDGKPIAHSPALGRLTAKLA